MKKRIGLAALAAGLLLAATALAEPDVARSGYTYVRDTSGDVTVDSRWNGRVDARRNLPISAGDEISVADNGHAEIALADGNVLHIGGRTHVRFQSLSGQQGEEDDFSAVKLLDGSVILTGAGGNQNQIPRVDTDDATVYLEPGARARVNFDSHRGTVVIARAGSVEVRTRQGSTTLRAGQYLMVREDEDPQIERGTFSRDRFDLWAADRLETLYDTRSVSARYVDQDYQSDVAAMDGYGDWNYNDTYSSYVWSPRVDAGWSPYSNGSWYYTPAGLTWWASDPWGWYPFHYGNWFFDASWSRWCWSPASVYSPAWVYWGYTPSFVGWCPIGYYSFFSPWYDTYYRQWGWTRPGVYISIRGTFNTRNVDFRGWNFTGAGGFSTAARMDVIPGSRLANRLGGQVAISSRPIVVNAREGNAREAVRDFVRQAPQVIERTASPGAERLAPILARERTLPPTTVDALRERGVIADRGRLAGPAAADLAPRGAIVERGRSAVEGPIRRDAIAPSAREIAPRGRATDVAPLPPRGQSERPDARVVAPTQRDDWRNRSRTVEPGREAPARQIERPPSDWRGRVPSNPSAEPVPPRSSAIGRTEDWRSRREVPPARRVIEGAVPGRRTDSIRPSDAPPPAADWRSRDRGAPAPRAYEPQPRPEYSRPARDYSPPPRVERQPPPSRAYEPRPEYSRPARDYSPPPRVERQAPAPAPRAEAPRAAPPPQHQAPDRSRKQ